MPQKKQFGFLFNRFFFVSLLFFALFGLYPSFAEERNASLNDLARNPFPHTPYPPIILDKARLLSPYFYIPAEKELQYALFFGVEKHVESKHTATPFYEWLSQMSEFGIYSKTEKENLFIRFANDAEAQRLYTYHALKIEAQTGIDACIILHTLNKESNGKENAVSRAGAMGISQTMPIVIAEILAKKQQAGTNKEIKRKRTALSSQIALLKSEEKRMDFSLPISTYSKKRLLLERKEKELKNLALIPDFTVSHPQYSTLHVAIPESMKKKIKNSRDFSAIEFLALLHGPLNMCFGMVHLAQYINYLDYYKKALVIDPQTETLLAAQLAYNCGLTGFKTRINSLGGWHSIFDDSSSSAKQSLPGETAHYGYLFIKWYMQEQSKSGIRYMVHSQESYHFKMCLQALKRSKSYHSLIKELYTKGHNTKANNFQRVLSFHIDTNNNPITCKDIEQIRKSASMLPLWPLTKEIIDYFDLLIESSFLPKEADLKACTIAEINTIMESSYARKS
jgi:hypothetical protein